MSCQESQPTFLQAAYGALFSGHRYAHAPPKVPVPEAAEQLTALVEGSMLKRTASAKSAVWTDFLDWAAQERVPQSADSATIYIMARRKADGSELANSTLARYASDLATTGERTQQGWDPTSLRQIARLLRQQAEMPNQAKPISAQAVYAFAAAPHTSRLERTAVLMLWKGCMRISDLLHLQVRDVVSHSDSRLLLDLWRAKSSSKIGRSFSDTRFALLGGEMLHHVLSFVRERLVLPPETALIPICGRTLLDRLKSQPGCSEVSGHSFRVGALQRLLALAGRGVGLTHNSLRLAARHADRSKQQLPRVTIQYLRNARVELGEFLTADVRADCL